MTCDLQAIRERDRATYEAQEWFGLTDAEKDRTALLAEVDRLQVAFDEECRWSVGWKDLAHRAERDRDRLRAAIEQHRDTLTADDEFNWVDERLWAALEENDG